VYALFCRGSETDVCSLCSGPTLTRSWLCYCVPVHPSVNALRSFFRIISQTWRNVFGSCTIATAIMDDAEPGVRRLGRGRPHKRQRRACCYGPRRGSRAAIASNHKIKRDAQLCLRCAVRPDRSVMHGQEDKGKGTRIGRIPPAAARESRLYLRTCGQDSESYFGGRWRKHGRGLSLTQLE